MSATMSEIETVARRLALENASDGDIVRNYWFPDDRQIRLVEVDALSIRDSDEEVRPLYFAPRSNTRFPMGIALIHPDEERRKALPADWGTEWERGRIVYDRERPAELS